MQALFSRGLASQVEGCKPGPLSRESLQGQEMSSERSINSGVQIVQSKKLRQNFRDFDSNDW